jgi:hypothetical protein
MGFKGFKSDIRIIYFVYSFIARVANPVGNFNLKPYWYKNVSKYIMTTYKKILFILTFRFSFQLCNGQMREKTSIDDLKDIKLNGKSE